MNPISPVIEDLKIVEVIYGSGQDEYIDLPVLRSPKGLVVVSRWTFTQEERNAVANGADIFLSVAAGGERLQPVLLEVIDQDIINEVKKRLFSD